jgi:aquaporin Z
MGRKFAAEFLGTAMLVFFGAGVAALVLGFRIFGASLAAGVIAIALAFGLIYAGLVYVIGPISGGHVNPAVTLGAYLANRISVLEMVAYWVAQLIGSIMGTLVLWWVLSTSPFYSKSRIGLGANGYGANSLLHIGGGGAFLIEIVLTGVFVLVVLSLTREGATVAVSGMGIGIALALANLIGVPFDGASVNPARSFGPAIVSGGSVLSQLWLFLIAPLVGAILATGVHLMLYPVAGGLPGAVNHALGRHVMVTPGDRFEPDGRPGAAAAGGAPGDSGARGPSGQMPAGTPGQGGAGAVRGPGPDPAGPGSPSGTAPVAPAAGERWVVARRRLSAPGYGIGTPPLRSGDFQPFCSMSWPSVFHCEAICWSACCAVMLPSGVCAPVTSAAACDQDPLAACWAVSCGSPTAATTRFLRAPTTFWSAW